ncbi:MAG: Holliday junction resolvase RuvX [Gammaproteobacteria bacterium]|nr:MAG: Holliday junction resolvase RuvX [Gammaproteobacteria bacterium]
MNTLLGFDFGERRIGVATGQTRTRTATALTTLTWGPEAPLPWDRIAALIREWQPDALVVGLPLHGDGTESTMAARVRRFARQLAGRFRRPVHFVDEYLTSWAAERSGARGARIDAEAARLLLQDWLDRQA